MKRGRRKSFTDWIIEHSCQSMTGFRSYSYRARAIGDIKDMNPTRNNLSERTDVAIARIWLIEMKEEYLEVWRLNRGG